MNQLTTKLDLFQDERPEIMSKKRNDDSIFKNREYDVKICKSFSDFGPFHAQCKKYRTLEKTIRKVPWP